MEKKWMVRTKDLTGAKVVRLPEEAKVLGIDSAEDETWLTYMTPVVDSELEAMLTDTERGLRHKCLELVAQAKDELTLHFMTHELDTGDAFALEHNGNSDYGLVLHLLEATLNVG